jgi:glycosyltransferase involved in cell wall biosynthesis
MVLPVATLALPVYNGGRYLRYSLDSLTGQDFEAFEIVIGDNGSTDDTEEICREYSARDDRIEYHRSDVNRGAAWNYNRLFHLARGRYFKWASHDDMVEPTYLSACIAEMESSPEAAIVFPRAHLIDGEGKHLRIHEDDWDVRNPRPHARLRHTINQHGLHNVIFGLMRTDALATTQLIGRFDGSDIILLSEMSMRGEFHEIPEPLFLRRMHEQMSRRALKNPRDVAKWFDTSAKAYYFTWTRLYAETMRAVTRAPISSQEKLECWRIVTADWQWKRVGREWYQTARELASRNPRDRYEDFSEPVEAAP